MNCPQAGCSKHFCSKYNLERHYKAQHLKLRPHYCQFCFRSFASKQNRLTHEYLHRTTPPESLLQPFQVPFQPYTTHIEPLTRLVRSSKDPDFRPFSKVVKVYYWPEGGKVQLPALLPRPQGDSETLPKLP